MNEKQLIKKIGTLKSIKPNHDWVVFTKREIMKEEPVKAPMFSNIRAMFYQPVRRPVLVYAFRGAMIAMVLVVGALFYINYLGSQTVEVFSNMFKTPENKVLALSINEIKTDLGKITASLDSLKNTKTPKDALTMAGVVKETVKRNIEAVQEMKNSPEGKQVLSSLGEIEDTLGDISEKSYSVQKEMVAKIIEDLKQRTLTDENKERLDKVIEYYSKGQENEAIILLIKILES